LSATTANLLLTESENGADNLTFQLNKL